MDEGGRARRLCRDRNGVRGLRLRLDSLREDFNYHYDGDCLGRLRRIVVETLDEVEAAAARPGRPQ